jgi:hypothetical protein
MKLYIKFSFLLFVLVFTNSCKKLETTNVDGKITDKCSGIGLAGKKVSLMSGQKNSPNNNQEMQSTTTSTDGTYQFSYVDGSFAYWVFCESAFESSNYLLHGKNNTVNFQISNNLTMATFELSVKNTSPQNNSDSIYIDLYRPNDVYILHNKYNYKGVVVDTLITIPIKGCAPYNANINWSVTKNAITTNYSNQITCTAGTVTHYNIHY